MKISELGANWRRAYQFCLEKYEFVEAARIAKYYKPARLYKYYSFNEFWRDNIFEGILCFNAPSNFNDPLDSRWAIDYKKLIRSRYEKSGLEWNKEEYDNENFWHSYIQCSEEDLCWLQDIFRITCFSETPYSSLMWGHYAQKHGGFCLEYNTDQWTGNILMPVLYSEIPLDASMLLDDEVAYHWGCPAVFKSKDWSYEKEWRMMKTVKPDSDKILLDSVKGSITGIYMGLYSYRNIDNVVWKEIEHWADVHQVDIYCMERSYKSYDLVCDKLQDIRSGKRRNGILGI